MAREGWAVFDVIAKYFDGILHRRRPQRIGGVNASPPPVRNRARVSGRRFSIGQLALDKFCRLIYCRDGCSLT